MFKGKNFAIAGIFKRYEKKLIIQLVLANGGEIMGGVTKKTDYLIAGQEAGSKLLRAKELGVLILPEHEFIKWINEELIEYKKKKSAEKALNDVKPQAKTYFGKCQSCSFENFEEMAAGIRPSYCINCGTKMSYSESASRL